MRRRNFIALATLATAGIAAGSYIVFENFDKFARKVIIKDTASLKIAPAEIDKFLAVAAKKKVWDDLFPFHHKQLIKWHYYINNGLFTLPYRANYNAYRNKIVMTFLLSSNFFANKMDESKPVAFTELYDPYLIPCSNPFSNIYYPQINA
ncbi:MAG: hypothetical protein QM802_00520 [Agriterribacter sp.]